MSGKRSYKWSESTLEKRRLKLEDRNIKKQSKRSLAGRARWEAMSEEKKTQHLENLRQGRASNKLRRSTATVRDSEPTSISWEEKTSAEQ